MRKQILVYLLLMACAVSVLASDALLNKLEPAGYVNDFADVIPAEYERRINAVIEDLQQKTGAEIAVVTLQSLDGGQIDDFTNRLFEKWGIGQKGKDNGLMFLAAMQDRKMRIEVGYGLEGIIPDSKAGVIRRDIITPHFKAGKPAAGILAGVEALSAVVQGKALNLPVEKGLGNVSGSDWVFILFLLIPAAFIGYLIYLGIKDGVQPARRGRYTWDGNYGVGSSGSGGWAGGGGGFSGGGGFGGGCSGGGGSSGGW
ncbi:TPM domain-containing protein [Pontiellaceae bacterium B1224]|nr:TPM domain-containing protein [Pontiellaceae bacterium B1224]